MRIEGQDHRGHAVSIGCGPQAANDLGMADVDAVEVAHRQRRRGPGPPAVAAAMHGGLGGQRHAVLAVARRKNCRLPQV